MLKKTIMGYINSYRGLPFHIWMLALVIFINRSGSMIISFMTLYLTQVHGYSVFFTGLFASVFGVGSLFGSIIGGSLTDKVGPDRVMFGSLFLSGLSVLLIVFTSNIYVILTLYFLFSLCKQTYRPANNSKVSEIATKENITRSFSLIRLMQNFGNIIGPILGGYLALYNYDFLFWADGLTSIFASLVFGYLFLFRKKIKVPQDISVEETNTSGFAYLKDKVYLIFLFTAFWAGFAYSQIYSNWPVYLKNNLVFQENEIGYLLSFNAVIVVLIEMPFVKSIKNNKSLKFIAIGSSLIVAGFAILPLFTNYFAIAFTVFVWTLGEIMSFPTTSTFVTERSTKRNRGSYYGIMNFVYSAAFIVGPFLGAWLMGKVNYDAIWWFMGVVLIIQILVFYRLLKLYNRETSLSN